MQHFLRPAMMPLTCSSMIVSDQWLLSRSQFLHIVFSPPLLSLRQQIPTLLFSHLDRRRFNPFGLHVWCANSTDWSSWRPCVVLIRGRMIVASHLRLNGCRCCSWCLVSRRNQLWAFDGRMIGCSSSLIMVLGDLLQLLESGFVCGCVFQRVQHMLLVYYSFQSSPKVSSKAQINKLIE